MQGMLATLVDELRNVGIGVSVGEHLDAAQAVSKISLHNKDVVRAALQSTLIKSAEHVETFNLVFDLVMASPADRAGALVEGMPDDQLSDTLRSAVGAGDRHLLRLLADEYVRRFGGLEPGRPVAGVFATIAVNQAADLSGIRAELLESGESPVQAEGEGLSTIAAEALDMPLVAGTLFFSLPQRDGWHCYTAALGSEEVPVATGSMLITDGVAQIGAGTTLEHARGLGCNAALLHRRLLDAHRAGCHTVFVEVGECDLGSWAAVCRNLRQAGFEEAYEGRNWQRPALHPAELPGRFSG